MREMAATTASSVALHVERRAGFSAEIDAAAAADDPRHGFLRRAWYAGNERPCASTLVARRPDGRIIAALPTIRFGHPALKLRSVPGSYWPFRSFPIASDASDAEIAHFLASPISLAELGRAWRLGPVLDDDPTLDRVRRIARSSGWTALTRHAGTTFVLNVTEEKKNGPWPKPSTVRNNHKHEKRLAKIGAIGWHHVSGSDWKSEAFDTLVRIETNSWVAKRQGADPKFLDADRLKGWQQAIADPVIARGLTAGILSIGETPACFSFGVNAGPVRFCIATSYDKRFAKHSPGSVTGYRTYAEAADIGVGLLNLGSGDGGQKSSMGAVPGPELVDVLFVRSAFVAGALSPLWGWSGIRR